MKPEDIENMQAGREMDILIINAVFGLEPQSCMVGGHPPGCTGNVSYLPYSTDIAAAWQVVEKLLADDITLHLQCDNGEYRAGELYWNGEWSKFADADTAPLAICRFALLAVREENDNPGAEMLAAQRKAFDSFDILPGENDE